jgi:hypothetical protein
MRKRKKIKYSGLKLKNSNGREIPVEVIRKDHLRKDATVKKIFEHAFKLQKYMISQKLKMDGMIQAYMLFWKKYNKSEDMEGLNNFTLSSYDNTMKIIVKSNDIIRLDDTRQFAEAKIKSCMNRWGKDAHPMLRQVINSVFKTDKDGFVNSTALRSLKQLETNDNEWIEAMELLTKAETCVGKRQYLTFQYRKDQNSKWKTLNLGFSSVDPEESE